MAPRLDTSLGSTTENKIRDVAVDVLEDLPFAFAIISLPDYRFLFLNRAAVAAMESIGVQDTSELLGKHAWEVLRYWDLLGPAYEEVRATRQVKTLGRLKYPRPDRLSYWTIVLIPSINKMGDVTSIATIGIDVTDGVETEQALRDSESRFRAVFDNAGIGIALVDRDAQVIAVNTALERMLGYTREELGRMAVADFTYPEDMEKDLNLYNRMMAGEYGSYRVEKRYIRKDGAIVWGSLTASLIRDTDGRPSYGIGVLEDITERKQAEQALIESEERLRLATEAADIGVWEWDAVMDTHRADVRTRDIAGIPEGTPLTTDLFYALVHPEDRESVIGAMQRSMEAHTSYSMEYRIVRLDGGIRWVLAAGHGYYDESGRLLRTLGIVMDMTERKQAEEQLRHHVSLLQRALLPEKPTIGPGYGLASRYIPAYEGQEIGGDFFDVFETEDRKVGILIGDVSGKGIEAAALASSARNVMRAFAYEWSSAGEAVTHANSVLAQQQIAEGHFVTSLLMILDPATGGLRYANAGHPPALVCTRGGGVEVLAFGQPPIGISDKLDYQEAEYGLGPGDRIVLYTDGVSEARHDGLLFGVEGIQQVLLDHPEDRPDGMIAHILDASDSWAHGRRRDDTAIIAIERLPEGRG